MQIQRRGSNGTELIPVESELLETRRIFIEGEIDDKMACEFVREMLLLNLRDTNAPIDILINSPGGEINSGMMMYDVIQSSKAPVRIFCVGKAYSMAAVLFSCGNHGRFMLPHSKLMLHEPLLMNKISGNSSSIKSVSESLMEAKKKINSVLVKHTGRTEEEVEEATSYDHYFSAEESISFGLCDGIVGFDKIMEG